MVIDLLAKYDNFKGKFIKLDSTLNTGLTENNRSIEVADNVRIKVNVLTL